MGLQSRGRAASKTSEFKKENDYLPLLQIIGSAPTNNCIFLIPLGRKVEGFFANRALAGREVA